MEGYEKFEKNWEKNYERIDIPEEDYEKLHKIAQLNSMSADSLLQRIIEAWLKNQEKDGNRDYVQELVEKIQTR